MSLQDPWDWLGAAARHRKVVLLLMSTRVGTCILSSEWRTARTQVRLFDFVVHQSSARATACWTADGVTVFCLTGAGASSRRTIVRLPVPRLLTGILDLSTFQGIALHPVGPYRRRDQRFEHARCVLAGLSLIWRNDRRLGVSRGRPFRR